MSHNKSKWYLKEDIQKELEEIYLQYHTSIKKFIGQVEVFQNKFPIEIMNEIRAVFAHIAKIYVYEDEEIVYKNLQKAKSHMKRAQLDSFKYMCYALDGYYLQFRELYKNVDLSYVNNGEFIAEIARLYAEAIARAHEAREVESQAEDVIESYEVYEEAYYMYAELYKLINETIPIIGKLQQKQKLQQEQLDHRLDELQISNDELQKNIDALRKENEEEKRKNKIITAISIALAIVSVVLGALAFV